MAPVPEGWREGLGGGDDDTEGGDTERYLHSHEPDSILLETFSFSWRERQRVSKTEIQQDRETEREMETEGGDTEKYFHSHERERERERDSEIVRQRDSETEIAKQRQAGRNGERER